LKLPRRSWRPSRTTPSDWPPAWPRPALHGRPCNDLRPENSNKPGLDNGFLAYTQAWCKGLDTQIAAYEASQKTLHASWKWPSTIQPTQATFEAEIAKAKNVGLAVEPPTTLIATMHDLEYWINGNLPSGTRASAYDQMGLAFRDASEQLKSYKAACNHKPTRNFLIDLTFRCQQWLDQANTNKAAALAKQKEEIANGTFNLGPVELTKAAWLTAKTAAYAAGMSKTFTDTVIETHLGKYDTATSKIPADVEKHPKNTNVATQLSMTVLTQLQPFVDQARATMLFPPIQTWLKSLKDKIAPRQEELRVLAARATGILQAREAAKK
jgi:hypothetical protein